MKVLCVLLALAACVYAEKIQYVAAPYAALPYPYAYSYAAAPAVVASPFVYKSFNFPTAANYRFQLDTSKAPSDYVQYPYGPGPFFNTFGVAKKAE